MKMWRDRTMPLIPTSLENRFHDNGNLSRFYIYVNPIFPAKTCDKRVHFLSRIVQLQRLSDWQYNPIFRIIAVCIA